MTDPAPGSGQASIVLASVSGFAAMSVARQAECTASLDALVAAIIGAAPAPIPMVLEAAGAKALVIADNPPAALDAAQRLQDGGRHFGLCVGVNHGPLRVTMDAHGEPELRGDGLASTQTIADFAQSDRVLVSRAFRDALDAVAPERAQQLSDTGVFTDTDLRGHALFVLDPVAQNRRRRRFWIGGAIGIAAILASGVGARLLIRAAAPPATPGIIVFDIKPNGEILIDGESKGRTPPLTELQVAAGHHLIEVRSGKLPPLKLEVNIGAGERITVSHRFAAPVRRGGLLQDLRRKLGI